MEEMRKIRNLKKQLETEYDRENAYELADALVSCGITELTEAIHAKILYLQQICKEISFEDYWFVSLVSHLSLDEIKERYSLYAKYMGCGLCNIDCLAFSNEKASAYISLLEELGLNSDQITCAMKKIVEHGSIAKSEKDARCIVEDLMIFEIPIDVRNRFISENAEYMFNDYSRDARQVFQTLCYKYGAEDGFTVLKEHPEYIRLGVSAVE